MVEPTVANLLEENRRLRRALDELTILNDLARAIAVLRDSVGTMNTIVQRSIEAIGAEQGVITLIDFDEGSGLRSPRTLVRAVVSSTESQSFHLHQSLLGWMCLNRKPLVISDPWHDDRFSGVRWDPSIRSLLCVPLQVKAEIIGVVTLYNKKAQEGFSDGDKRLLAIIAAQSAQVIENARLYEEEKAYFRMREEVSLASQVQMELLPKSSPRLSDYEITGKSLPAETVGGDYFDFIEAGENRIALCVGDVTGKGLPAALLMANLQATIRSQCPVAASAQECVSRANRLVVQSTDTAKFVTLFYGILDTREHKLYFSNAGHNPPFLFSGGGVRRLVTGGTVLGFLNDSGYSEESLDMNPGDYLMIYSDGITEARNVEEDEFGEHRLIDLAGRHAGSSAEQLLDAVFEAVDLFSGGAKQTDDMTMVVLKRRTIEG